MSLCLRFQFVGICGDRWSFIVEEPVLVYFLLSSRLAVPLFSLESDRE